MNRLIKKIFGLFLSIVFLGCYNNEEPKSSDSYSSVYLDLIASFTKDSNSNTKALVWRPDPMNGRPVVTLARAFTGSDFPALIIIKNKTSNGQSNKTYYLEANFRRVNMFQFKLEGEQGLRLDRDIYGTAIELNKREEWYVMAYFKGTWNKNDKTMTYSVNKHGIIDNQSQRYIKAVKSGTIMRDVDQPMILPWVKMSLSFDDDNKIVKFSPETNSSVSIRPMGTIITAQFQNLSEDRGNNVDKTATIIRVKLYSNVLSMDAGHYKLAEANLPALPSSTNNNPIDPIWYPNTTANNNTGYYDSDYLKMSINDRDWHTPNVSLGSTDVDLAVFWAMPMPLSNTATTPKTELRAEIGYRVNSNADRRNVRYKTKLWESSSMPKHNSSIGILGKVNKAVVIID